MADYIEKEALMKNIQENPAVDGNHRAVQLLECIINAPTVDAAPVRHGRWIKFRKGIDWQCSECNYSTDYNIARNYCPNCGARMDKEDAG